MTDSIKTDFPLPPDQIPPDQLLHHQSTAERKPFPGYTGLAVACLVSGIIGMSACPLVAPPAIILGVVVLIRVRKGTTTGKERAMALIGTGCGIAGLFVGYLFIGWVQHYVDQSHRLACARNLQEFNKALLIYSFEHLDQGVPTVEQLIEAGTIEEAFTQCPNIGDGTSNYTIVRLPGVDLAENAVLVYEPKSNHQRQGGYFLFADESVRFIYEPKYTQLLKNVRVDPLDTEQ